MEAAAEEMHGKLASKDTSSFPLCSFCIPNDSSWR
jgi:hypothetical protein